MIVLKKLRVKRENGFYITSQLRTATTRVEDNGKIKKAQKQNMLHLVKNKLRMNIHLLFRVHLVQCL